MTAFSSNEVNNKKGATHFLLGQDELNGMSAYRVVDSMWDREIFECQQQNPKAKMMLWIFCTWWSIN